MFNISQNGFIPQFCLEECPREFKYLDEFINKYQKGEYQEKLEDFRQEIILQKVNVDECIIHISGYQEVEIQKIYSATSFLAHLYVWSTEIPDTIIPKALAVPWYLSSKSLGIACVLTHASVDMYNWRLVDPEKPFSLDNIEPQYLFNLDPEVRESEKWFYLPMIAIEGECGCIIHKMDEIYQILESYSAKQNKEFILKNLEFIEGKMERQYEILQKIFECDPEHFYHLIRPYLSGSLNEDSPGWYLEGIEMFIQYVGGSAAQSSLIPAEDTFLGVKHPKDKFLRSMREYMPEGDRKYLEHQDTRPGFPELRIQLGEQDYLPMEEARQRCIKWLKKFRDFHYKIVQKYVGRFHSMTGTGGTNINQNLRQYIENTEKAKKKPEIPFYRLWNLYYPYAGRYVSWKDVFTVLVIIGYFTVVFWLFAYCEIDNIYLELLD